MKTSRILIALASATLLLATASTAPAQNLFESDTDSGNIYEFVGSNGLLSTNATLFFSGGDAAEPTALAFDSGGNLFVGGGDGWGYINEFMVLSTNPIPFASGLSYPRSLAFDGAGNLFEADEVSGNIYEFINDNGVLTTNPTLFASGSEYDSPFGLVFDRAGDLFEAEESSGTINEFINNDSALSPTATVFASGLGGPAGLAIDNAGDLFEAEYDSNKINEFINSDGVLSTNPTQFASGVASPLGLVFDSAGDLFAAGGNEIYEFVNVDGVLSTNPTVFASGLVSPFALAFSPPPPSPLSVTKLQATVNFNPSKTDIDTCRLTATLGLGSGFSVTNQTIAVYVAGARATFLLNAKGSSKTSTNSCKLSYTKKTEVWTLTASMDKGSWATAWAQSGVTDTTTPKAGVTVNMLLTVTIGTNRFATEESLLYKATTGKFGTLK